MKKIGFMVWARLQSGSMAVVYHERASLRFAKGLFIMEGPSGIHTLHADATNDVRLAAHWKNFASHEANQYKKVEQIA
jgi:hypothetical protein